MFNIGSEDLMELTLVCKVKCESSEPSHYIPELKGRPNYVNSIRIAVTSCMGDTSYSMQWTC